ncbi:hypothetical protein KUV22_16310 [Microbulbifer agarilyticus]|uniref:hypothetical protein n=1 Tax=Microbulbifer agarilyticus TaxID=260552 RepID=UPI001C973726|nr:hypothetical protein [Microbulbifer agarilyticus]MBY6191992.1 hypothetical protein [Microbulbifer agarilyticus]
MILKLTLKSLAGFFQDILQNSGKALTRRCCRTNFPLRPKFAAERGVNLQKTLHKDEKIRNPVNFNQDICTYFVWVSNLGVNYMKNFHTPEEAFEFISKNEKRCVDITRTITESEILEWVSELKAEFGGTAVSYEIAKPFTIALMAPVVVYVIGLLVYLFADFLSLLRLADLQLTASFVKGLLWLGQMRNYFSAFAAAGSAFYITIKLCEIAIYRKYIFRSSETNDTKTT